MFDKIKLLKIIGSIVTLIFGVIGIVVLFGYLNLSCITAPERVQDEANICYDAKYIAYAYHKKEGVSSTDVSNAMASCRNLEIWKFCEMSADARKIMDERAYSAYFENCLKFGKMQ